MSVCGLRVCLLLRGRRGWRSAVIRGSVKKGRKREEEWAEAGESEGLLRGQVRLDGPESSEMGQANSSQQHLPPLNTDGMIGPARPCPALAQLWNTAKRASSSSTRIPPPARPTQSSAQQPAAPPSSELPSLSYPPAATKHAPSSPLSDLVVVFEPILPRPTVGSLSLRPSAGPSSSSRQSNPSSSSRTAQTPLDCPFGFGGMSKLLMGLKRHERRLEELSRKAMEEKQVRFNPFLPPTPPFLSSFPSFLSGLSSVTAPSRSLCPLSLLCNRNKVSTSIIRSSRFPRRRQDVVSSSDRPSTTSISDPSRPNTLTFESARPLHALDGEGGFEQLDLEGRPRQTLLERSSTTMTVQAEPESSVAGHSNWKQTIKKEKEKTIRSPVVVVDEGVSVVGVAPPRLSTSAPPKRLDVLPLPPPRSTYPPSTTLPKSFRTVELPPSPPLCPPVVRRWTVLPGDGDSGEVCLEGEGQEREVAVVDSPAPTLLETTTTTTSEAPGMRNSKGRLGSGWKKRGRGRRHRTRPPSMAVELELQARSLLSTAPKLRTKEVRAWPQSKASPVKVREDLVPGEESMRVGAEEQTVEVSLLDLPNRL